MATDAGGGPEPTTTTGGNPRPKPAAPARNPALKMLGLPRLPRKLPSRNWLIFWAVGGSLASAIVYDRREKKRATARWRHAVEPLSRQPLDSASQLPRKITVYLEAPPGDGLRAAQDHFIEYVKPVLAASGLDWEFVQGRQQGDVRAAVAAKVRRDRMPRENRGQDVVETDDGVVEAVRERMGVPRYEGIEGDVVIGRHTWKEYVRGLHEGWLGPLDPPPLPPPASPESSTTAQGTTSDDDDDNKKEEEATKEETKKKPPRPPQPPPHNTTDDYTSAVMPAYAPTEFPPSTALPFPHRLGIRHTFVRLGRFLNRRKLADDIGRQVAAVCWAQSGEWKDEQQTILEHEEKDWPKSVWEEKAKKDDINDDDGNNNNNNNRPTEKPTTKELIWASPMVVDARLADRMRRFHIRPEDDLRAASIVVPEEQVEGWIKGSLRGLCRWAMRSFESKPRGPDVGDADDGE
ncbi:hypothetical protein L249_5787 [Ophiocordyceps polyrhachis-furcata BCC 54312]|uniref:Mitochondrial import inner membrane translocase subunit TIM54 n=1 Tax=Ophiocordyceps polyrhachis-furcata BCC 54312 TaxID=1330021 RepID=A0A367L0G6_9HYPO|nr:hypothetical protein L249_5787 [Ophiocordyceps polyrhachis-furcata BCC 54312]